MNASRTPISEGVQHQACTRLYGAPTTQTFTMRLRSLTFLPLFSLASATWASTAHYEVRDDLHFPLHARATNKDGSLPIYKDANASIEDRVNDLLPRMTLEEKVAQLYAHPSFIPVCWTLTATLLCIDRIQGDMNGWMDFRDPLDNTLTFNQTGLVGLLTMREVCYS